MEKLKKKRDWLIYALWAEALLTLYLQIVRWTYTWIFVALYWALLTWKNRNDMWMNDEVRRNERNN